MDYLFCFPGKTYRDMTADVAMALHNDVLENIRAMIEFDPSFEYSTTSPDFESVTSKSSHALHFSAYVDHPGVRIDTITSKFNVTRYSFNINHAGIAVPDLDVIAVTGHATSKGNIAKDVMNIISSIYKDAGWVTNKSNAKMTNSVVPSSQVRWRKTPLKLPSPDVILETAELNHGYDSRNPYIHLG